LDKQGCPESVLVALELMTHIPDIEYLKDRHDYHRGDNDYELLAIEDEYLEYIKKLSKNDLAREVKIQDLLHNGDIRRVPDSILNNSKVARRLVKYAKALKLLTGGKVGYC